MSWQKNFYVTMKDLNIHAVFVLKNSVNYTNGEGVKNQQDTISFTTRRVAKYDMSFVVRRLLVKFSGEF